MIVCSCLTLCSSSLSLSSHMLGYLLECVCPGLGSSSFALTLTGGLLGLQFLQSSFSLCGTDLTLLGGLLFNVLQGCTNNSTLYFAGTCSFLFGSSFGNTLLV